MTWFVEARLAWIKEMIEIFGFINRDHVTKKFGVTKQVASKDFGEVAKRWPELMRYDATGKRYVRK